MRTLLRTRCAGYSLLELLVTLAIAAGLIRFALPGYGTWIAQLEQRNAANALLESLQLARTEAIKRSTRVTVCASADGSTCVEDAGWDHGWLMFADPEADGQRDPLQTVVRSETAMAKGVTITGNKPVADYVSYTPYGQPRLLSGALQMGTFTVCRHGLTALELVLASSGRPRIAPTTTPCP